jgi:glucose/arabinose dehydrogenase
VKSISFGGCLVIYLTVVCGVARGQVDERPIDIKVIQAFEGLQWPDSITGAAEGLTHDPRPIVLTGAGDGSQRIFVATEFGTVHILKNGPQAGELKTFLDIRDRVLPFNPNENEQGFLGLAFHPKYKENGQFFVFYSAKATPEHPRVSIISRFHVSGDDPDRADPASEEVLLRIERPYWNHDGGTLAFGPDGYLYIVTGDGGLANDPHMNGQNLQSLLAKVLRIDVDHKTPADNSALTSDNPLIRFGGVIPGLNYAIPKDNPFVNKPMLARGEVWAYGLRNIWRLSFDRETGTCWAGDVGQDTWEEIDIIRRGGNYGWNLREGRHPFGLNGFGPTKELIDPIWDYHHNVGKCVIGGFVYRGKKVPELEGAYLYADYVTGQLWALWYDAATEKVTANRTIRKNGKPVLSYGEDDDGEVYFLTERDIFKFVSPQ